MKMKLSIVTPSYNQGEFIEQTITSVLMQKINELEYIIIDGGSNDNTIEILKKYDKYLTYWISEPDSGQTNAINKGLKISTGEIVAYICSDDYYDSNVFDLVISIFKNNKDIDIIYGGCTFIDEFSKTLRIKKVDKYSNTKLLVKNIIWQPTVFMRRNVIDSCGYFDEKLNFAMDYEYWLRAAKNKCNFYSVDKNLAFYRWHKNSKTVSLEKPHLREAYEVSKNYGGGGVYSYFLHNIYWPNTSSVKRFIFRLFSMDNIK
jgi:glycosyltransferase involved in cell wall biosynthesis